MEAETEIVSVRRYRELSVESMKTVVRASGMQVVQWP